MAEEKAKIAEDKKEKKEEVKIKSIKNPESAQIPEIKPGMTVKVHQKITEIGVKGKTKKRIQIFEGIVLACNKNKKPSPTILVRKISNGIGVEKIFPIHAPTIVKIEPLKQAKIRQAKPYYLRSSKKKLKEKIISAKKR